MELRFPLDMGILIITCPNCKTSFKMDPDDPRTYHHGTFDLSQSPPKKRFTTNILNQFSEYLQSKKDIRFLIPIFLFLLLLLNLIKIFNNPQNINEEKEKQEIIREPEFEKESPEDNTPYPPKPSVEI